MDLQERIRTDASETGQSSGRSRSTELHAVCKVASSSIAQFVRIPPKLSKLFVFRTSSSSGGKRRQSSSSFRDKLRKKGDGRISDGRTALFAWLTNLGSTYLLGFADDRCKKRAW